MWLRQGAHVEDGLPEADTSAAVPAARTIAVETAANASTPAPVSAPDQTHDTPAPAAAQARRALLSSLNIGQAAADNTAPPRTAPAAAKTAAPAPAPALPAADWATLPQLLNDCRRCNLAGERRNSLPGRGSEHARLLVISPNPAPQDDIAGELLSGEAGVLLNNMLTAAGIDPAQVYYTSQVKCTPTASIHPGADARAACLPWLAQQLAWLQPKAVLLLGQDFLPHPPLLASVLGGLPYVVVPHPARLLRQGTLKAQAWPALQTLAAHLAA
nr:uracil-DNA glycosylase [Neisseria sp. HSC-16F19]